MGLLLSPVSEDALDTDNPIIEYSTKVGIINPDLTIGTNIHDTAILDSNSDLAHQGVIPVGTGFRLLPSELVQLGYSEQNFPNVIRIYKIGRDLTQRSTKRYIIDFYGLSEDRIRAEYPALYQRILDRVRPERAELRRKVHRERWWVYAEPRSEMRRALNGEPRYIATCRTAKHRIFQFEDISVMPDAKIICIALSDPFFLAVMSSHIHVLFAERIGVRLGVGDDPNYNHSDCFGKFPFPDPSEALKARIRGLGERLDTHRKAVLEKHDHLTMTGLYNVLEKVRAETPLSASEKDVYDAGLVGVLRQIHDDLDEAVAKAYGWPTNLSDEDILERLVALNKERAVEERAGKVRWLRPEFQAPKEAVAARRPEQIEVDLVAAVGTEKKQRLPTALSEQVALVRAGLAGAADPVSAADLAQTFAQGKKVEKKVEEILRTLAVLGQAEKINGGYLGVE